MKSVMRIAFFTLFLLTITLSGIHMATLSSDATFQNPVIQANFPDPFILKVDDLYYAYSTNSSSRNVPYATSTNLVDWEMGRDAMPALASWVDLSNANVWAPEVLAVGDQYLLYYTARDKTSNRQCIGLAISDSPRGPFRDRSTEPFICQANEGGSIDANPFRDEDGKLYLLWKNDGNCCMMPTYIFSQELSEDGTELVGEAVRLIRNGKAWHGPVVEAPTMWLHEGQYYLFYSANLYAGPAYAVGYARCESPLGPCEDAEENPILATDTEGTPLAVGPGHQTLFKDDAGDTWMIYHVWQITSGGIRTDTRQVWIDKVLWEDGHPVVQGPTREAQPVPVIKVAGESDSE